MIPKSLFTLLETTGIIHPTSVREIRVSERIVIMELDGFPWWLPSEKIKGIEEASATIEFTSISRAKLTESCLSPDHSSEGFCSEDLDDFSVASLEQVSWNKGNLSEVFCSEPLVDPIELLTSLERFLTDTKCPFGPLEFVNGWETLESFISLSRSDFFQIAKGPDAVCQIISKELHKQGVKHTVTQSHVSFASGYLVQWWDGFLICDDAKISWNQREG